MAEFEHYKQLDLRVKALEQDTAELREGIKRLMELQAADRVNIDKIITVLFGDKKMGLVGLLDRLHDTEIQLTRGRIMTNFITITAAILNFAILIYLFVKL